MSRIKSLVLFLCLFSCSSLLFAKQTLEAYFYPQDNLEQLVLDTLKRAQESIDISIFSFGSQSIKKLLEKKLAEGVRVRLLADRGFYNEEFGESLMALGAMVIKARKNINHNKYLIVDGIHLLNSSANFSAAKKVQRNKLLPSKSSLYDENSILCLNCDENYLRPFKQEFEAVLAYSATTGVPGERAPLGPDFLPLENKSLAWFTASNFEISKRKNLKRKAGKEVVIHTHFSSPREITKWSQMAMDRLFSAGITVRNQAVLQDGVNNTVEQMVLLTRKLGFLNIQPYYVYMHDMVPGCEHFRTTLREGVELEKAVRGTTAGFHTPTFVCDLPGGGGKRHVASYEYYDEENGISVWKAPNVKPGQVFTYFDPIHKLSADAQKRWKDEKIREEMVQNAIKKVK